MHRFYCPDADLNSQMVVITDPDEIHHLKDVLRLLPGAKVAIFNGDGREAAGEIAELSSRQARFKILNVSARSVLRSVSCVLACAVPKKAKFEFIIEKTTELGVDEIIPLMTKRTEVRWEDERAEKKISRYQTVAINAAKQSKRNTVPVIQPPATLPDVLKRLNAESLGLIPCLTVERKNIVTALASLPTDIRRVILFIGPEGDFTPQELDQAIQAGCVPVSLGDTVLKVDTAALCAVAAANLILGPTGGTHAKD